MTKYIVLFMLLTASLIVGCGTTDTSDSNAAPVTNETPFSITPPVSQIVQGKVADTAGQPVVEAVVAASGPGVPEIAAITNESGEYIWSLPVGTFTLTVIKEGFESQSSTVTLTSGQTLVHDFVISPAP